MKASSTSDDTPVDLEACPISNLSEAVENGEKEGAKAKSESVADDLLQAQIQAILEAQMESIIEEKVQARLQAIFKETEEQNWTKKNGENFVNGKDEAFDRNTSDVDNINENDTTELSDENTKRMLFVPSTHRLLFMDNITLDDGKEYEVRYRDRLFALFVALMQIFCLIGLAYLVWEEMQGSNTNTPDVVYDSALALWQLAAALFLVYMFLLSDLLEAFILFRCKGWKTKVASILVILTAMTQQFVSYTIIMFGRRAGFSVLGACSYLVGVIFVYDIDEYLGYYRDILRKTEQKHCCLELQFTVLFVSFAFFWAFISVYLASVFFMWLDARGGE